MRQFIVETANIKNGLIELIGKDFRYLRQVLRVKKGDMLNVRIDDGELLATTVSFVDDSLKKITLQVCRTPLEAEKSVTRGVQASELEGVFSKRKFVLFQFIPKAQKMELIVRQAAECGISVIVPVIGEFSDSNCTRMFEGAKNERFGRIIKEARQQSGSPVDTKITKPMTLLEAILWWKEFSAQAKSGDSSDGASAKKDADQAQKGGPSFIQSDFLSVVLWERTEGEVPLFELLKGKSEIKNVCIAVGNEGGISPSEIKLLQEKGFFSTIHFDVNILRCETAALYGIAAVQSAISQFDLQRRG